MHSVTRCGTGNSPLFSRPPRPWSGPWIRARRSPAIHRPSPNGSKAEVLHAQSTEIKNERRGDGARSKSWLAGSAAICRFRKLGAELRHQLFHDPANLGVVGHEVLDLLAGVQDGRMVA